MLVSILSTAQNPKQSLLICLLWRIFLTLGRIYVVVLPLFLNDLLALFCLTNNLWIFLIKWLLFSKLSICMFWHFYVYFFVWKSILPFFLTWGVLGNKPKTYFVFSKFCMLVLTLHVWYIFIALFCVSVFLSFAVYLKYLTLLVQLSFAIDHVVM